LTDFQYVVRYRATPTTSIGAGPSIHYNWSARLSRNKLTFPIGLGIDTLKKIGPLPVKFGAEAYLYLEQPDIFGPQVGLRLIAVPVILSPKWTRKPIFGH
jgi:hypothetical protein